MNDRTHRGIPYGQYCTDNDCWCQAEPYRGVMGTKRTETSNERISDLGLRNIRSWASTRHEMSGSQAIVAAIDELLKRRAADTEIAELRRELADAREFIANAIGGCDHPPEFWCPKCRHQRGNEQRRRAHETCEQRAPVERALGRRVYLKSERDMSGYRVVIGFDTLTDVQAAHQEVADIPKAPTQKALSVDPNPLDPENHYFRKCLKGHVSYAISFSECPSCKIERERSSQGK